MWKDLEADGAGATGAGGMMDLISALSAIGAVFVGYCAICGAYIILRWGTCGVACIWRFRRVLDQTIKDDIQLLIRGEDEQ